MSAHIVVGPTKVNPLRFRALDRATDSGAEVGTSAMVRGRGVAAGWKDHTNAARSPSGSSRSARVARALVIVAATFARLRTIPASPMRRSTSRSSNAATDLGSKPANASRKAGRLRRIVAHDSPDWKASRDSRSNIPRSSRTGIPHSVS